MPCSSVFSWWRCGPPARAASSACAKSVTLGSLFSLGSTVVSWAYYRPDAGSAVPVDWTGREHVRAERTAEDLLRGSRRLDQGRQVDPVSTPISCSIETTSSLAMLPVAPAAPGSRRARRSSTRRNRPPAPAPPRRWLAPGRGCCGSGRSARPRRAARGPRRRTRRPGAGWPSRSCRRSRPRRSRRRRAARRSRRRAPPAPRPRRGSRRRWRSRPRSAARPLQRSPASRSSPASDSSIVRLTFLRLWVSEAETKTLISSKRSRRASARSSPRSFGISTEKATPSRRCTPASTSSASASCGITSGRTNEVTSSRFSPVAESRSISRIFSAVGIVSGSFWKPSRGPTSRMRTALRQLGHGRQA